MATAIPHRVPAAGARSHNAMYFVGSDDAGRAWGTQLRNGVGGSGATHEGRRLAAARRAVAAA